MSRLKNERTRLTSMDFGDRNFKMAALESHASETAQNGAPHIEALNQLGLHRTANPDDIRNAFRARVKSAHPDLHGGTDARLRQLILARNLLMSDRKYKSEITDLKETSVSEIRTSHGFISLSITLDYALRGGEIIMDVPALEVSTIDERLTSLTEMRTIRVKLPKGLRDDEKACLKVSGAAREEAFFRIHIDPNVNCRVWGDDIWMTAEIEPYLMQAGGRALIETPHGPQSIQIDKDIPRGASLCLAGKGLPATETCPAGNLYIRIEALSESQRDGARALTDFRSRWAS